MIVEFFTKCPECGSKIASGRKETIDGNLEIICPDCKYRFTSSGLSVSAEHTRQYDDIVQQTTVKYCGKNPLQLYDMEFLKTIPTPQILFPKEAAFRTMSSISVEGDDVDEYEDEDEDQAV